MTTQLDPTQSSSRPDESEIIPVHIAPVQSAAMDLPPSDAPSWTEMEQSLAATHAERELTGALAELKRRSERVVDAVESVTTELTPKRIAIGVGVAVGVTLLVVAVTRRARRPRRRQSTFSLVARSLVREAAGRMMLGAAATIGARLAEAAVPMIAAAIVERTARAEAPKKARRSRKLSKPTTTRKTSKVSKRISAAATAVPVSVVEPERDDETKRFGNGTRDAVEEASWESFPASDPAAFYR
ncbi:MAG: hypothetical protein J0L92_15360 [Deltaproteobacteria bacterium]|nr:hypothetical protein [Deltaproteobacteria bacterium]